MKQYNEGSQQRIQQPPNQFYTQGYKKVNAYTKPPATQQILAVVVFIIVLILHSIFIVPPIVAVSKHAVLIFLLTLHYLFILMIGYDYVVLTVGDPVDSLVEETVEEGMQKIEDLRYCIDCHKNRFSRSYHCRICQRCTQDFDHHCRYLNNCVGGKNYQQFFRILVVLTLYFINVVIQSIWIFVYSFEYSQMQDYMISKWPVLVVMIIMVVLLLGVDSLLVYHLYLNLARHMTTVEYIFRNTPSNQSQSQTSTSETNQSIDKGNNC